MSCAACGHSNPVRAKCRLGCGTPFAMRCASCGVELLPAAKGSLELAEPLDPEAWHRILERFFEILTEGVHRLEGTVNPYTVNPYTGDGIVAPFGTPIAHEDHAQRACYAVLHLRDAIGFPRRRLSFGPPLAARRSTAPPPASFPSVMEVSEWAGVSGLRRSGKRILESKPREAREVAVRRCQHQAVLDGERGQMCVRNQIRARGRLDKQSAEHLSVSFRRRGNPNRFAVEPFLDLMPCRATRRGPLEDTRVRDQAEEGEQTGPGQPHPCGAVQSLIEPGTRALVLIEVLNMRVDQEVRVNEDQWKRSPSAAASASATSSTLSRRQRPRETAFVTWGLRGVGGASRRVSPSRSASFTSCFRLPPRRRRACSRSRATSSSSVRVVRMHQSIL